MSHEQLKAFLLYTASGLAAIGVFYLGVRYVLWWVLPFLLAFAVASMIEPAVQHLHTHLRWKRGFSALVLTLFLLFVLGGLCSLLGSTLLGEAAGFLEAAPQLLARAPEALSRLEQRLEHYCAAFPPWLQHHLERTFARGVTEAESLLAALERRALQRAGALAAALPRAILTAATSVLAVYFISASYPALRRGASEYLSRSTLRSLRIFKSGVSRSVTRWLRAQAVLCAATFAQLLAGFLLLRERYALLLSLITTLVDALPVFGTGTVLIPWALGELLLGSAAKATALAALYLSTLLVRNLLEPRLLSRRSGLPPVASLMAMYWGFCAFGVGGMILFPFLLLLSVQVYQCARQEG